MNEPAIRGQVLDAINDPDRDVQRAAIQIALERLTDPHETSFTGEVFAKMGSSQRSVLIEEVSDPKFLVNHLGVSGGALSQDQAYFLGKKAANRPPDLLAEPIVFKALMASLGDPDANVRAAALDLMRKVEGHRAATRIPRGARTHAERSQSAAQASLLKTFSRARSFARPSPM